MIHNTLRSSLIETIQYTMITSKRYATMKTMQYAMKRARWYATTILK